MVEQTANVLAEAVSPVRRSPWPRYEAAALGFRNYWYPAMPARQLGSKPKAIRILGEKLVFVRSQGKCYVLEDRCPHRGVPLSAGDCQFPGTNTITCAYHGWTFDLASGLCVAALTDGPESGVAGRVRIAAYPVEERRGFIWVFIGDQQPPPPLEQELPAEILDEAAALGVRVTIRKGNWRLAAENGLDPSHAAYLHRRAWLTTLRRFPAHKTDVRPLVENASLGYTQGRSVRTAEYPGLGPWPRHDDHWWKQARPKPTVSALHLPGYLRVDPFPARGIVHFEWYVPIDATRHRYFQILVKKATGLNAWRFRLAYWLWWRWLAHVHFNGQDAKMVRLSSPFYEEEGGWDREILFRPDRVLTAWRKYCHENCRGVQEISWTAKKNSGPSRPLIQ
jgi:phenylpropionate dioxygenase-like ring-hydroxylating dioxygenase large terminal subunit